MFKKIISLFLSLSLVITQPIFAQGVAQLNLAQYLGQARPAAIDNFQPTRLRYFSYDNLNNSFRILLDKGDAKDIKDNQLKEQAKELMDYFLIGLALPNDTFWVNLRPDSPDNIIDPELEKTDLGRILLEADLQLKKDTAGLTSPQTPEGKQYWDKLYKKAGELFGTENITIPTITRPWIVPGEIIVRESGASAYIYKATLKVLLEQDHLKDSSVYNFSDPRLKELNEYSSRIIRETIIPKLTQEVNSSKRYAKLRQVYYSLVLSRWFKQRNTVPGLQSTGQDNSYAKLIDSGDLTNLTSKKPYDKLTYFKEYQESFAKGEYNLKEPVYTPYGQSIRTYMSGGVGLLGEETAKATSGMVVKNYNQVVAGSLDGEQLLHIPTSNAVFLNDKFLPEQPLALAASPIIITEEDKGLIKQIKGEIKSFLDNISISDLPAQQDDLIESYQNIKKYFNNNDIVRAAGAIKEFYASISGGAFVDPRGGAYYNTAYNINISKWEENEKNARRIIDSATENIKQRVINDKKKPLIITPEAKETAWKHIDKMQEDRNLVELAYLMVILCNDRFVDGNSDEIKEAKNVIQRDKEEWITILEEVRIISIHVSAASPVELDVAFLNAFYEIISPIYLKYNKDEKIHEVWEKIDKEFSKMMREANGESFKSLLSDTKELLKPLAANYPIVQEAIAGLEKLSKDLEAEYKLDENARTGIQKPNDSAASALNARQFYDKLGIIYHNTGFFLDGEKAFIGLIDIFSQVDKKAKLGTEEANLITLIVRRIFEKQEEEVISRLVKLVLSRLAKIYTKTAEVDGVVTSFIIEELLDIIAGALKDNQELLGYGGLGGRLIPSNEREGFSVINNKFISAVQEAQEKIAQQNKTSTTSPVTDKQFMEQLRQLSQGVVSGTSVSEKFKMILSALANVQDIALVKNSLEQGLLINSLKYQKIVSELMNSYEVWHKTHSPRVNRRIVFLGPPGAGKGTHAAKFAEQFGIAHISTGDLLRQEVAQKTDLGNTAKEYMTAGKLVPDKLVQKILIKRLIQDDAKKGFILDGYPRNEEQAKALDKLFGKNSLFVDLVVDLQTRDEIIIGRISGRRVCKICGATYHVSNNPPKVEGKCDKDGGELYQREDDKKETVRNRILVYNQATKPLIAYYLEQGKLHSLDANGAQGEVFGEIIKTVKDYDLNAIKQTVKELAVGISQNEWEGIKQLLEKTGYPSAEINKHFEGALVYLKAIEEIKILESFIPGAASPVSVNELAILKRINISEIAQKPESALYKKFIAFYESMRTMSKFSYLSVGDSILENSISKENAFYNAFKDILKDAKILNKHNEIDIKAYEILYRNDEQARIMLKKFNDFIDEYMLSHQKMAVVNMENKEFKQNFIGQVIIQIKTETEIKGKRYNIVHEYKIIPGDYRSYGRNYFSTQAIITEKGWESDSIHDFELGKDLVGDISGGLEYLSDSDKVKLKDDQERNGYITGMNKIFSGIADSERYKDTVRYVLRVDYVKDGIFRLTVNRNSKSNITIKYTPASSSLIAKQEEESGNPSEFTGGGIDFTSRAMKIGIESMGSFADLKLVLPEVSNAAAIDLDNEFKQIQVMASSGIRPSDERILEFEAACYYRGEFGARLGEITACLQQAHFLDERLGRESSPALRLATMLPEVL